MIYVFQTHHQCFSHCFGKSRKRLGRLKGKTRGLLLQAALEHLEEEVLLGGTGGPLRADSCHGPTAGPLD